MLGKCVKIRVTNPIGASDAEGNFTYRLNFGTVIGRQSHSPVKGAFIMGVNHPVRHFDGRVIAVAKRLSRKEIYFIVAPKSKRFIIHQIKDALSFLGLDFSVDCFYERSCGAIVLRDFGNEKRFLLIKNKRSAHWGFPKGHIEEGETDEDTARREVLEETGLHIELLPGFKSKSEYMIQGKIEKTVLIFLAQTNDTETIIQPEEIEDYIWLNFDNALSTLNYENDKAILQRAQEYIIKNSI